MNEDDRNKARSTSELDELIRQVGRLQFALIKKRVMDQIRDEIWHMKSSEDMERILVAVQNGLRELEVSFYDCRVNLVDDSTDPPSVLVHAMTREGSWIESKEPGTEAIIQIWRDQQVAYRQDL